jgi:hypothetical protein
MANKARDSSKTTTARRSIYASPRGLCESLHAAVAHGTQLATKKHLNARGPSAPTRRHAPFLQRPQGSGAVMVDSYGSR